MAQGQRTDLPPCLFCRCGCGRRVRRRRQKFIHGHVPAEVRAAGGRNGAAFRRFKARRRIFGEEFDRLTAGRKTVTKADILDAFALVADRFYLLGYKAADNKHESRQARTAA